MSSNFGQVRPQIAELAALVRLEKSPYSQGARNLKIRSAQLTRQKMFDCVDDKNYPSTTFLGTSYGQIMVAIFQ